VCTNITADRLGHERRSKFALASVSVVGGLIFAQIVTQYLTPVFCTYMDSLQTWLGRGRHKESGRARLALSHEPLLAPHAQRIEQNP